jgi:WD40 repeat protein
MIEPTPLHLDDNRQRAWLRIVKALPTNLLYYGSALAAIALIPGAPMPAELKAIAEVIGVTTLGNILERVVKDESISDDEIRQQVEAAIKATNIDQLFTEDTFQRSLAQLVRRLDLLKSTVVEGDQAIMRQLAKQYDLISSLKDESRKARRPALNAKPRVFISYARKDGQDFAGDLRERLLDESIPLWQDRMGMEGGRDWWQQITEAIDNVEFMVLIMTPAALQSDVIRREWRYARLQGVCVYPVKGVPDTELDYKSVPKWMRDAHWYNLDHEWQKFVNDLNTRCEVPRVPFMVEDLPEVFVQRPKALEDIISQLLDEKREEPVAITAALRGAGGFGKTTLARAVCHDERIQQAFDDGILWVTLGEDVQLGEQIGKVLDLIETLSGERPSFTGLEAATTRLTELFEDRDILLVIDDLWKAGDAKPFLQGGKGVARLITTRDDAVLPQKAARVVVESMETREAVQLLTAGLQPPPEAMRDLGSLAAQLGEWALVLKLVNGILHDRIARGQTFTQALDYVQKTLQKRGIFGLNLRETKDRRAAAAATLALSMEALKGDERERFIELAIFPEDVNIPLETVARLWDETGGLDEIDTEDLCTRLYSISLLLNLDLAARYIRLHDVVRHYLWTEAGADLPRFHAQLLDSYRLTHWRELPNDEPYLWDWLAYHLTEAGRGNELVSTVKDIYYMAKKTSLKRSYSVENDLVAAEQHNLNDTQLRLLRRNYSRTAQHLNRCHGQNETVNTLYWRLQPIAGLISLLPDRLDLPAPRLEPVIPLTDIPHPNLIRTLQGHTYWVFACQISPDNRFIVSASLDKTLKVWDTATGVERFTLSGHTDSLQSCQISADNRFIVSASDDGTLKVWDTATGVERFTLVGHANSVRDCQISPDNRFIVSASSDNTLKVWDTATGVECFTLIGHTDSLQSCQISPDNRFIVSASDDGTLKVWDTATGAERFTLVGHANSVRDCQISPDNRFIVSASSDKTLKVWDTATGVERFTLSGHTAGVLGCQISPDNRFIVSASSDNTLKVWDTATGAECFTLSGHSYSVWVGKISPDNRFIVSASSDNTLKVWDTATGTERFTLTGHTDWVSDCQVSPDNRFIVSASDDKTLKVWDTATGTERFTLTGHTAGMLGCQISADNRFIVSASKDETLKVWDTATSVERFTLAGHTDWVRGCQISPDNRFIVSASLDNTLKVWEMETGAERFTLAGHTDWVRGCQISPDNHFIVSASDDKTLKVWDTATGVERFTLIGHTGWVRGCQISPDNRFIVSASDDKTLKVWDTATGVERFTLSGHTAGVLGCQISPDNRFIVSASDDGTLKVWESANGDERFTLIGHTAGVRDCQISPDGNFIMSASDDKTLKVWETNTGSCMATFFTEGAATCCAWYKKDYRIVAGSEGGHLYFLRFVP